MYAIVFVGSDQKQKKKGVVTFIVLIRNTDPSRRNNKCKMFSETFTVFYSAKFIGKIGFLCAGGGQVLLRTGTRQKTVSF